MTKKKKKKRRIKEDAVIYYVKYMFEKYIIHTYKSKKARD